MTNTIIAAGQISGGLSANAGDVIDVFGTDVGATIFNGGVETVHSGGSALTTTVSNGGTETLLGGSATTAKLRVPPFFGSFFGSWAKAEVPNPTTVKAVIADRNIFTTRPP